MSDSTGRSSASPDCFNVVKVAWCYCVPQIGLAPILTDWLITREGDILFALKNLLGVGPDHLYMVAYLKSGISCDAGSRLAEYPEDSMSMARTHAHTIREHVGIVLTQPPLSASACVPLETQLLSRGMGPLDSCSSSTWSTIPKQHSRACHVLAPCERLCCVPEGTYRSRRTRHSPADQHCRVGRHPTSHQNDRQCYNNPRIKATDHPQQPCLTSMTSFRHPSTGSDPPTMTIHKRHETHKKKKVPRVGLGKPLTHRSSSYAERCAALEGKCRR